MAPDCHYVAVVVAQLTSDCLSPLDKAYGNIKVNVDLLRSLEIAFNFLSGRLDTVFAPACHECAQFNLICSGMCTLIHLTKIQFTSFRNVD